LEFQVQEWIEGYGFRSSIGGEIDHLFTHANGTISIQQSCKLHEASAGTGPGKFLPGISDAFGLVNDSLWGHHRALLKLNLIGGPTRTCRRAIRRADRAQCTNVRSQVDGVQCPNRSRHRPL
jgi:hypothetical protein